MSECVWSSGVAYICDCPNLYGCGLYNGRPLMGERMRRPEGSRHSTTSAALSSLPLWHGRRLARPLIRRSDGGTSNLP